MAKKIEKKAITVTRKHKLSTSQLTIKTPGKENECDE